METRHSGLLFQSKGPIFFLNSFPVGQPFVAVSPNRKSLEVRPLVHSSRHRNIQLMQYVRHLRIPQARRVVLERQMLVVVNPEAPPTISVRKSPERPELFFR